MSTREITCGYYGGTGETGHSPKYVTGGRATKFSRFLINGEKQSLSDAARQLQMTVDQLLLLSGAFGAREVREINGKKVAVLKA